MATETKPKTRTRRTKSAGQTLTATNPATGKKVGEYAATPAAEIPNIVEQARKVFPEWAGLPVEARVRHLKQVRYAIYDHLDEIVEVIHEQVGKPRPEVLAHDIMPPALDCLYYERIAPRTLRTERRAQIVGALVFGGLSSVESRPFGVVGVIAPWNYPFSLALAGALPALFAGNTVVLKPSEVTPGVGELLRKVFEPLPSGVATVVQGAGDVGAALIDAPCDKICFIGSPETGRKIAEAAAKHLTPVVMELGGMDPAIVLEDADLDVASSGVLWGGFVNGGQTCAASERAYIVDEVYDEFREMLTSKLAELRTLGPDGEIGPLTLKRQFDVVKRHVDDAVAKGATVLSGGPESAPVNKGGSLWYPPTVLEGVTDEMDISKEETFGPVLPLIRVRDAEDAVRRANEDGFSLTASVYTRDENRARAIGHQLRAGAVGLNEVGTSSFGAPWGPWGGIGQSGYGRVKGVEGLREFTYPVHMVKAVGPRMKRFFWYPYDEPTRTAFRGMVEILTAPTWSQKLAGTKGIGGMIRAALKGKL